MGGDRGGDTGGDTVDHGVGAGAPRPLLTLGRVDVVRVQVGFRTRPDGRAHRQYLLDLPAPGDAVGPDPDQEGILLALEPVLRAGEGPPRHYSVHQHRWHSTWGASPGALEIGLLVTTGREGAADAKAADEVVAEAFRTLLEAADRPDPGPTSRDAALHRARRGAETAYGLEAGTLSLSAEQHSPADGSWTLRFRTRTGEEYEVVVGFVDGYAGSVRVRHAGRSEVFDAVGSE